MAFTKKSSRGAARRTRRIYAPSFAWCLQLFVSMQKVKTRPSLNYFPDFKLSDTKVNILTITMED